MWRGAVLAIAALALGALRRWWVPCMVVERAWWERRRPDDGARGIYPALARRRGLYPAAEGMP